MKYVKIIVVAVLAISLLINIRLMLSMDEMKNRVDQISNNQMQLMNNISSQTSTVSMMLDDFKKEQSWITPIRMDMKGEDPAGGSALVNFEWQIKELPQNAEVVFHYKIGEEQEYRSVPATAAEEGLFQVSFPVDVEIEPEWFFYTTISDGGNMAEEEARSINQEMRKADTERNQISYYVTSSSGEMVKSSEVEAAHLGEIGTRYYGALDVNVHLERNGYNVSVAVVKDDSKAELEKATLIIYKDGKATGKEELVSNKEEESAGQPAGAPTVFHRKSPNGKMDFTRLVLEVAYSNGETFRKEIYTK
ncbi:hypothetical protein [Bacillus marinisedimentorum]|uniref:hypothetical protein n=1 Tax=Bacillus marinisedimentorum TaxID=1821260 RepID=UPI0007DE9551|nr:hypothetical protein [Bacillus marinisedimentorum]